LIFLSSLNFNFVLSGNRNHPTTKIDTIGKHVEKIN